MFPVNGIVISVWLVEMLLTERLTPLILVPATTGLTAINCRGSSFSTKLLGRAAAAERAGRRSMTALRLRVWDGRKLYGFIGNMQPETVAEVPACASDLRFTGATGNCETHGSHGKGERPITC